MRSWRRLGVLLGAALVVLLLGGVLWLTVHQPAGALPADFSGSQAFRHVEAQMNLGPRVTGSAANRAAGDYIAAELSKFGWETESQSFTYQGTPVRSIIGRANRGAGPIIILGAHYDTRRRADRDKSHPDLPVPGANDGASGVAVLLELARVLKFRQTPYEVWLAFFDAEDDGGLDGWDWIVGSTYMAEHLTVNPQAMVLVDMVGDSDQQFFIERNSDAALSSRIWAVAGKLGYGAIFNPQPRYALQDDHVPFARRGIPAADIIDFDYGPGNSYWHTTADTIDKVSSASLERVGRTLVAFLQTAPK